MKITAEKRTKTEKERSRNYVTERDSAYVVFTLLLTKHGSYGLTWSEVYSVSQGCACGSRSRFNRWSQRSRQSNRAEATSEDWFLSITNKLVKSILRTSLWRRPSAFQAVFGSQPVKQARGGNIWHERADFYSLDYRNRAQFKSGYFILRNDGTNLKADMSVKVL